MSSCKGVCIRYRALKGFGKIGRYSTGQKRCSTCQIFIKWQGLYCPCCNYTLRISPRTSILKQKLWEKNK